MKREKEVPAKIVEFQSDALELKDQKLPFLIRCCVWIPFLVLACAIGWACWAEVDVVIQANGRLVTDKQTIVMKPLERSVIKEVHVKIGDVVKKDQILFTFDPTFNQAEAARLENEQVMLNAELARLDAEAEGKEYTASGNQHEREQLAIFLQNKLFYKAKMTYYENEIEMLSAELARLDAEAEGKEYTANGSQHEREQFAIFRQNSDYYQAKMNYFAEANKRVEATVKSRKDTLRKQEERLAEFQKLETSQKKLFENTTNVLRDLIEITVSRMEIEANIDILKNELQELAHRTASLDEEKEAFKQEWMKGISEKRVEVRRKLTTMENEEKAFVQEWMKGISEKRVETRRRLTAVLKDYDKVKQLLEYVELRAPCDAVVHEIATFSPGSAVQEAEALITLVPLDGTTEIECEIRPQDIGKVQVGSNARIKISAYPFQKHGTLDGQVRMISENTHQKTEGALTTTYYRGRMSVNGELKNIPENFRLIPGMEVQCEIKCDKRRVIEYVLYPLIKGLDEAIREP